MMRADDSVRSERCRGQGCGRLTDVAYMEDGVCPGCTEHETACEHCNVVCDRAVMERVDPSDLVCRECADVAHAEQERAEGAGEAMGIAESEGWR